MTMIMMITTMIMITMTNSHCLWCWWSSLLGGGLTFVQRSLISPSIEPGHPSSHSDHWPPALIQIKHESFGYVGCLDVTHMLCFDFQQFHQCLFHISAFFVRILLIVIIIILSTVLWSRSLAFVDCWHGSNRISRLIRPPRHCQAIVRHSAQNPGTYHLAGHWFNFGGEQLQRNIYAVINQSSPPIVQAWY